MPKFTKNNSFGKGRPKGSGYVQRCTRYADKKAWGQLERLAEGKRPLDPKEEKKAIKEEGGLIPIGDSENTVSPIQNDIPSAKLSQAARKLIIQYGCGMPRVAVDLDPDDKAENSIFGLIGEAVKAERQRQSDRGSSKPRKTST